MKNFILILIFFTSAKYFSQEIDWDRISFGIAAENQLNKGDWGKYWGNANAAGVCLIYELEANLFLESSFLYSSYNAKSKEMPEFSLLKIPLGLSLKIFFMESASLNAKAGLVNNTFLFNGKNTVNIENNKTESEMGIYTGIGLEYYYKKIGLEIFGQYQSLFSEPETLESVSIGGRLFYYM